MVSSYRDKNGIICDIGNQIGSHLLRGLAKKMRITKKQQSIPQNYFFCLYGKHTLFKTLGVF